MIARLLNQIFVDGLPLELWLMEHHYWYIIVRYGLVTVFMSWVNVILLSLLVWHFFFRGETSREDREFVKGKFREKWEGVRSIFRRDKSGSGKKDHAGGVLDIPR